MFVLIRISIDKGVISIGFRTNVSDYPLIISSAIMVLPLKPVLMSGLKPAISSLVVLFRHPKECRFRHVIVKQTHDFDNLSLPRKCKNNYTTVTSLN